MRNIAFRASFTVEWTISPTKPYLSQKESIDGNAVDTSILKDELRPLVDRSALASGESQDDFAELCASGIGN